MSRYAWISLLIICFLNTSIASPIRDYRVPILAYHHFDASGLGSTTVSPMKFEAQLKWLKTNGFTVIPLQTLVNYLQGKQETLPEKSIVITVDDGRESVYTEMYPLVIKYQIPVTLFIYPSSISNAKYAMTWEQLKILQKTGLFDIQSHTYWHPNFKQEKKRLSPADYHQFVQKQLLTSKNILNKKLNINVTLLAWPFGIYDHDLEQAASQAGYTMAFSIDGRPTAKSEKTMAQPRYMLVEKQSMKQFIKIVLGQSLKI